jgi:hypothetical protein
MEKEENEKNEAKNERKEKTENRSHVVEEKYPEEDKKVDKSIRIGRPYFIAAIVILIILIVFLIGSMFRFNQVQQGPFYRGGMTYYTRQVEPRQNGGSFFFSSSSSSNGSSTTTSVSAVSGVVTAVNGSSFDIGGGGTKTTVNTNGNTTWNTTNKSVAVNDSVTAFGTVSGSTLTATSVQVDNF